MIRSFTVVALMCMTSGETATAFDLTKTLNDLMPCEYAAIRLCERPQHVNAAAFMEVWDDLGRRTTGRNRQAVWPLRRYGAALN
jgi:hypothetical protein